MARYQPGQSGNPAGKPPGIKNANTRARLGLAEHLPMVLKVLVQQAEAGDLTACKLILDKTMPSLRPQALPALLPGLGEGTPAERGESVIQALADGRISPDLAVMILTALAKVKEINANGESQIDSDFTITIHDATEYLQMQRDEQHG